MWSYMKYITIFTVFRVYSMLASLDCPSAEFHPVGIGSPPGGSSSLASYQSTSKICRQGYGAREWRDVILSFHPSKHVGKERTLLETYGLPSLKEGKRCCVKAVEAMEHLNLLSRIQSNASVLVRHFLQVLKFI